jgi:hypothetical protein
MERREADPLETVAQTARLTENCALTSVNAEGFPRGAGFNVFDRMPWTRRKVSGMSGVCATTNAYREERCELRRGIEVAGFPGQFSINMNTTMTPPPIRTTHGTFQMGRLTGKAAEVPVKAAVAGRAEAACVARGRYSRRHRLRATAHRLTLGKNCHEASWEQGGSSACMSAGADSRDFRSEVETLRRPHGFERGLMICQ